MKTFIFLSIFILGWVLSSNADVPGAQKISDEAQCSKQLKSETGGINKNQPIEVGQVIYQKEVKAEEKGLGPVTRVVSITYLGRIETNLKIKYVEGVTYGKNPQRDTSKELLLPLDKNKQSTLTVYGIEIGPWSSREYSTGTDGEYEVTNSDGSCETAPEELTLKLFDEQDRITVATKQIFSEAGK